MTGARSCIGGNIEQLTRCPGETARLSQGPLLKPKTTVGSPSYLTLAIIQRRLWLGLASTIQGLHRTQWCDMYGDSMRVDTREVWSSGCRHYSTVRDARGGGGSCGMCNDIAQLPTSPAQPPPHTYTQHTAVSPPIRPASRHSTRMLSFAVDLLTCVRYSPSYPRTPPLAPPPRSPNNGQGHSRGTDRNIAGKASVYRKLVEQLITHRPHEAAPELVAIPIRPTAPAWISAR